MLTLPIGLPSWMEPEDGIHLDHLEPGAELEVCTVNRCYRIVVGANRQMVISGHPAFCPEPVEVRIHGSTWGGSMLKKDFVAPGMRLEFHHPQHDIVTTSPIVSVREVRRPSPAPPAPQDQDAA